MSGENLFSTERGSVILILLSPIMFWLVAAHLWVTLRTAPLRPVLSTIDPNAAPWYELSLLPRIGPSLAWEIVDHREAICRDRADGATGERACRAFNSPADLDAVRGIGPVTLQRIGPFLRFEDGPPETNVP